ncbi:MAG: DEAD/DEAH box helicase [Gammaproteobacteria bacterium]|nr:DEAD/DEAH box helicase [Gammaproteobacteria bacterium]
MTTKTVTAFDQLNLSKPLLKILNEVGYETPSPIQAETIPLLIDGKDIIGQAQTGTGKTAAFALPFLSNLNLKQKDPQVLVLAPTRELAIQVAEAFQKYATYIKGFHVLPVYGGQDYSGQIRSLKRGVHVVVGTPGRVMDHIRKGTLKLKDLGTLVLDEADEMLRMGFIDDVEWILEQTPDDRQIALFSATMPSQIRRIATKYLNDPVQVTIKVKTATAETIRQRYWPVSGLHKLDALTRILEAEVFDAMLVFVRTRTATTELAEKLAARGYSTSPLNGDIQQKQRERTIDQLKKGKIDILVATDVAARGLDVTRISHVVNYDIPHDTESYIHRIGRTGRAGKEGDAILFVAPREKRMLSAIEKATRKKIELMELPSTELINDKRVARFKQRITDTLANDNLAQFTNLIEQYEQEHNVPAQEIASALAKLLQGDTPLLLQNKPQRKAEFSGRDRSERPQRKKRDKPDRDRDRDRSDRDRTPRRKDAQPGEGMHRYRIEVGKKHEVKPGNIVGAIANEAGLTNRDIGHIEINEDHSVVDLPKGMPNDIFNDLKTVWVSGQQLKISKLSRERPPKGAKDNYGSKSKKPKRASDDRKKTGNKKNSKKKTD